VIEIIQAPMAGVQLADLAIAVSDAGGLGSLPCAMLTPDQLHGELAKLGPRPVNLNFFCHPPPTPDPVRERAWRLRLGVDPDATLAVPSRNPFDQTAFEIVLAHKPTVVSFHFGLPAAPFVEGLKRAGIAVWSSATSVDEARYLDAHGCDAIIAQGFEAGGHRGTFLGPDQQVGTFALLPRIVDAVRARVIAAGGIADARGVRAARALGASAVQIGTAYLSCPEARISDAHRAALRSSTETVITNVYTGRVARGIPNAFVIDVGPMSELAPAFPLASVAVSALRAQDPALGPFWAGQHRRVHSLSAADLTAELAG
jgi:nitronate monooxygenase